MLEKKILIFRLTKYAFLEPLNLLCTAVLYNSTFITKSSAEHNYIVYRKFIVA